ncbi:MAG TPA: hypothetical protein VGK29_03905 [Paludibaculum sp.]|jgi:hypothetical protein
MALLVDGDLNRIEDLKAQDTSVLDVAASEGIDLEEKLNLAWQEVQSEVEFFLVQEGGATVEQVAVSVAMKSWHVWKTLEAVYRDAFFSQLNDRFGQRWRHWVSMAEKQRVRVLEMGLKVISRPVRRPTGMEVEITAGDQPAGSYWLRATYVDESGQESAPSRVRALGALGPHGLTVVVAGAMRWNLYAGASPEAITLQNAEPMAAGTAWVMPAAGLWAGRVAETGQIADGTVRRVPRNWRG